MYERLSRKRSSLPKSYSCRSFTMQGVADVLTCLSDSVVEQGVFFPIVVQNYCAEYAVVHRSCRFCKGIEVEETLVPFRICDQMYRT